MSRALRLGAAAVAGLVFGAGTMLIIQGGRGLAGGGGEGESAGSGSAITVPPATTASAAVGPLASTTVPGPRAPALDPAVLAWSPGGLPAGLAESVDALPEVSDITVVQGDPLTLSASTDREGRPTGTNPPSGMMIDLDVIAVDPATFAPFAEPADRSALSDLTAGEALLGDTSARLRDVAPGDRLVLTGGATLTVAGVVDDNSVGAAEVVVAVATAAAIGIDTPRYLLARPAGPPDEAVAAIRATADRTTALQVRSRGETPYLRNGDAVLPQSRIKAVFGEFAHAGADAAGGLRQDPRWTAANIVEAEVPILGRVRCHRSLLPALEGALQELADRNLAGLVQTYDGCHNARRVRSGATVSRHAWGAAIDLNFTGNRTGLTSIQDPRLIEVMARWGLASGDGWLVPDPGHFEYVAPPRL